MGVRPKVLTGVVVLAGLVMGGCAAEPASSNSGVVSVQPAEAEPTPTGLILAEGVVLAPDGGPREGAEVHVFAQLSNAALREIEPGERYYPERIAAGETDADGRYDVRLLPSVNLEDLAGGQDYIIVDLVAATDYEAGFATFTIHLSETWKPTEVESVEDIVLEEQRPNQAATSSRD